MMSKDQDAKGAQQQNGRQRRPQEATEAPASAPFSLPPGALMEMPDTPTGRPLRRRAALRLQRSHGNQAVQRLLRATAGTIQRVGPDDEEADAPAGGETTGADAVGPAANPALTDEEQQALFDEATAAFRSGDYRTAVDRYRRLMQTPNLPESALSDIRDNANLASRQLLEEASKLYERGDFSGAVEIFRFLGNQPGADPAAAADMQDNIVTAGRRMFEEASAAFERGDFEAAIAGFRAIREIPELAAAGDDLRDNIITASGRIFHSATDAYAAGDYEGALAGFDALLEVDELPEDVRRDILFNRGRALQQLGRHEEALADLEAYAAQAPTPEDQAEAEALISELLTALGSPDESGGSADEAAPAEAGGAEAAGGAAQSGSELHGDAAAGPDAGTTANPAERLREAMGLYRGADYWGAIPLLERVRDSADATDAQRLEAQRHIGLAYYAVGSYTFAAHNLRRYQRMPGANPDSVAQELAEAEQESQRAGRAP